MGQGVDIVQACVCASAQACMIMDTCEGMRMEMCTGVCMDMCTGMCMVICTDMCMSICTGWVQTLQLDCRLLLLIADLDDYVRIGCSTVVHCNQLDSLLNCD